MISKAHFKSLEEIIAERKRERERVSECVWEREVYTKREVKKKNNERRNEKTNKRKKYFQCV